MVQLREAMRASSQESRFRQGKGETEQKNEPFHMKQQQKRKQQQSRKTTEETTNIGRQKLLETRTSPLKQRVDQ